MEPDVRFTAIGAALLVLLFAALGATVWLTGVGQRADLRHYTIYFERQSLVGLQVGGDVEMRGVQVGRVERFSIARDNINRVQVTIRVAAATPVSTNTEAVVERKILTGLARVSLVTPGAPGPELTAVPPGERYPVIAEGHSQLDQISDVAGQLAQQGTRVLASMDDLLNRQNREEIAATIVGIRAMAEAIRKSAAAAEKAGLSADATAIQAAQTLRDLSYAAATLERATESSVNEFRATAQELRATADAVARAAERVDDPRALIFGPSPAQLGPGEKLR
jgi:phospholipid/cholesterol/gamma-HCH transport system substrate-binding protein